MDALLNISSMTFGEKLEALAAKKNLDRPDVFRAIKAMGADITSNTLHNYFNSKTRPDGLNTALCLARVLEVSLDYLADDSIDEPPAEEALSEGERLVLEAFRDSGIKPFEAVKALVHARMPLRPPG